MNGLFEVVCEERSASKMTANLKNLKLQAEDEIENKLVFEIDISIEIFILPFSDFSPLPGCPCQCTSILIIVVIAIIFCCII